MSASESRDTRFDLGTRLADAARLRALYESGLTAAPDPDMQYYADRVQAVIGVPVALVSLVEADQQVFPGMVGLPEPWNSLRYTPLSHSFCQHVVADSAPLLITDARMDLRVRDNLAVSDLDVAAYAGFPLTDSDGRVLGSLCAIDHVPRDWSPTDLDTLHDLARACSTELRLRLARHLAAQESARRDDLEGQLRGALQRSRLLLAATQALTSKLQTDHKLAALVGAAVPALADACAVYLFHEPAEAGRRPAHPIRTLRTVLRTPTGNDDGPLTQRAVDWPGADPITEAVTTADTVIVAYDPDDPPPWTRTVGIDHIIRDARLHTAAMVPVIISRRVHAVLAFGAGPGRTGYGPKDRELFGLIAAQAGLAVQQGSRYEHVRDTSLVLQRALLTDPPQVPGLDIQVRYRPALTTDEVGGDWYDVFSLPDGDLAVAVGDVAGHDINAAATMGQARAMLRGFAHHDNGQPDQSMRSLDQVVHDMRLAPLITGVHARLRRTTGPDGSTSLSVRWTNAGHPPPVIVRPGLTGTVLDSPRDAALGIIRGATRTTGELDLPTPCTILLFTDGLFERRDQDIDDSLTELVHQAAALADRPLSELCDALVDAAPHDDDIALIALRTTT